MEMQRRSSLESGGRILYFGAAVGLAMLVLTARLTGMHGTASAGVGATILYVDAASGSHARDCTDPASPCATIGQALRQARAGDAIFVAQGTYSESLVITAGVRLQGAYEAGNWSRDLKSHATTIHGDPTSPVVEVQSGESGTTVLDGLTIRGGGGGVHAQACRLAIQDCRIVHNHGGAAAGGIEVDHCLLSITNTLIADNTASEDVAIRILTTPGAPGPPSGVTVHSCTIANNRAPTPRSVIFCSLSWSEVRNCIVWGNDGQALFGQAIGAAYSDMQGCWEGPGNICQEPAFVDPARGDYHLRPDSPCLDIGASEGVPIADFEGNPRPCGTGWDMGFDERPRMLWLPVVLRNWFVAEAPTATPTATRSATPTSTTAATSTATPTLTAVYKLHGLNFSPYIDEQDPNHGSQIAEPQLRARMQVIASHTHWIRTFGCGGGLELAGVIAHEMGLKIAASAWLGRDLAANATQIDCLIAMASAGQADIAIVGSEVLYRDDLDELQLIDHIGQVRAAIPPGVPVTTAEVYSELLKHPDVLSVVDVVFMNAYPYWEGIRFDHAVAALQTVYGDVAAAAAGKPVVISETGWPSCGSTIGDAVPSLENACFYFLDFVSWARASNVPYFYFEAFDETWKAEYEGPQGACWGIWDKDGHMKPCMQAVFVGPTDLASRALALRNHKVLMGETSIGTGS